MSPDTSFYFSFRRSRQYTVYCSGLAHASYSLCAESVLASFVVQYWFFYKWHVHLLKPQGIKIGSLKREYIDIQNVIILLHMHLLESKSNDMRSRLF